MDISDDAARALFVVVGAALDGERIEDEELTNEQWIMLQDLMEQFGQFVEVDGQIVEVHL